ncbi:MAG: ABC transporter ATP-binding protein [archaeon]
MTAEQKTRQPILRLERVWKAYRMGETELNALREISLEIMKGEFVSIIGASGSGKSTLMNLMGCLDLPSRGSIYLKGKDISTLGESELAAFRGKTIGFVFQQYNLIHSMSALENVLLPLEFQEAAAGIADKRAREVLGLVGLSDRLGNRPSQLSGGQQQRVSVARSLANDPEIILADEPTGALDSATGRDILELLRRLWKEQGKTVILVTHDISLAKYAEKIIELKDGKIIRRLENS